MIERIELTSVGICEYQNVEGNEKNSKHIHF